MPPSSRRAAALSPDERRAMLIAATLPLVLAHGADVSTRQIAEAAGVAEGTIFRVFDTKEELVRAASAGAFDPAALVAELRLVDRQTGLQDRLVAATELMQAHVRQVFRLLHALRAAREPDGGHGPPGHRPGHDHVEPVLAALAELIEPDEAALHCSAREAARRLRMVTFAGTHPLMTHGEPLSAAEIVSLLLDGVRVHAAAPSLAASEGPRSC